jgi:pSer/pThr/pTyr-binding forkhead associated (FHA) protein
LGDIDWEISNFESLDRVIAQLIPLNGDPPITLTKAVTVIGRQADVCDVVIDVRSISKVHCVLARTDGLVFVRDIGSTNGTRVNGQKIVRGALLPGDEIAFASLRYGVHLGPSAQAEVEPGPNDRTQMLPAVDHPLK